MRMLRKFKKGLYDPKNEKDSCGIGFVANIYDIPSREIVDKGLKILGNLTHRGAVSADPKAGDGVGLLTQIPHQFFQMELSKQNIVLPRPDDYAIGMFFLPRDPEERNHCVKIIDKYLTKLKLENLYIREVPKDESVLGESIRGNEPYISQIFIKQKFQASKINEFEQRLFIARRRIEIELKSFDFYIASLSSKIIVYKGMIMSDSLKDYYDDLKDEMFISSLAIVHQRFSTNTFPSWDLAQPFRFLCHNGEINTLRGNANWMNARAYVSKSELFLKEFQNLNPLIFDGLSDSAAFDNALEYLMMGGYDIEHAMMLLIPEAWEKNNQNTKMKDYYQYYSNYIEPWDGPAAMCFTNGKKVGAILDRNGLRPSRYIQTDNGLILLASEMGVLDIDPKTVVKRWRLEPGKIFLIDLMEKRVIGNDEIKSKLAKKFDYKSSLNKSQIFLDELKNVSSLQDLDFNEIKRLQSGFGYTKEDINFFIEPILKSGAEPIGSMGTDTPISLLSDKPKLLFSYFKQCFAQVTNPPIDPIREELVMSLEMTLGEKPNIFDSPEENFKPRLEIKQPMLTNRDIQKIKDIEEITKGKLKSSTIDILFKNSNKGNELRDGLERICFEAKSQILDGTSILILSDKNVSKVTAPIPSLLAISCVHHFLIKEGLRMKVSLVVETGEARELHHFAVLSGYGAEAINPYLVFDTISTLVEKKDYESS